MGLHMRMPNQDVQLRAVAARVQDQEGKTSGPEKRCKGKDSCRSVPSKSQCDVYWAISRITPARKLGCRMRSARKDLRGAAHNNQACGLESAWLQEKVTGLGTLSPEFQFCLHYLSLFLGRLLNLSEPHFLLS